jgi:hypothetical protein
LAGSFETINIGLSLEPPSQPPHFGLLPCGRTFGTSDSKCPQTIELVGEIKRLVEGKQIR